MDISVSHLNNRMALQVPDELPLGLVFIVGEVRNLKSTPDAPLASFALAEREHQIVCRLPCQVVQETLVKEGDRVRVSGRLTFNPHHAQYMLSARDLEVLSAAVQPVEPLATEETTAAGAPSNLPAPPLTELPSWVKKLAPPEVQKDLGLAEERPVDDEATEDLVSALAAGRRLREDKAGSQLPREMLDFLSSAIDSDEEIELTPQMIAQYLPAGTDRSNDQGHDGAGPEQRTPPFGKQQSPFPVHQPSIEASLGPRPTQQDDAPVLLQQQSLPLTPSTSIRQRDPWQLALLVILTLLLLSTLAAIFLVLYISL